MPRKDFKKKTSIQEYFLRIFSQNHTNMHAHKHKLTEVEKAMIHIQKQD